MNIQVMIIKDFKATEITESNISHIWSSIETSSNFNNDNFS